MENGKYGPGNTKFEKLTLSKVQFTHWDAVTYEKTGCGATALGLLTGKNPIEIAAKAKKLPKGGLHFSDRFMVEFLRKNKFSVYQVNKANSSNRKVWRHTIMDNNLILFSLLTQKAESSWFILYNHFLFHNYQITKANYLDFINFPTDSMYVLTKSDWA